MSKKSKISTCSIDNSRDSHYRVIRDIAVCKTHSSTFSSLINSGNLSWE